jgi:hypothetical protein
VHIFIKVESQFLRIMIQFKTQTPCTFLLFYIWPRRRPASIYIRMSSTTSVPSTLQESDQHANQKVEARDHSAPENL